MIVRCSLRAAVCLALLVAAVAHGQVRPGIDWRAAHAALAVPDVAREAYKAGPGSQDPDSLYRHALACLTVHADDEAASAFDRMLADEPDSLPALWGRAEVMRRRHALTESRAALELLLARDPDFHPARISLAYLLFTQADFEGAIAGAAQVLSSRYPPDLANRVRAHLVVTGASGILAHQGGLLAKMAHGRHVLSGLRAAERLAPGWPEVLFARGCYCLFAPSMAGGSPAAALRALTRAVEGDPGNPDFLIRLAQAHRANGQEALYRELIEKAGSLDPESELLADIEGGRCLFICVPPAT